MMFIYADVITAARSSGVMAEPSRTPVATQVLLEKRRRAAVRTYLCLSLTQFALGASSIVCSAVSVKYKSSYQGVPYYSGGFINGLMLLISSLLSFRVYNKGPLFASSVQARKEVMCAVNWQRVTSFAIFFSCLIGLALIWMYNLCIGDEDQCSYKEFKRQNNILAIACFSLGAIGLVTAGVSVVIVRKYGIYFGVLLVSDTAGTFFSFRDERTQDIVNQIRRENATLRRQMRVEEDNNPYVHREEDYGLGYANFGFVPCELPPYSPRSESSSSPQVPDPNQPSVSVTNTSKTYQLPKSKNIPIESPPPYSEAIAYDEVTHV